MVYTQCSGFNYFVSTSLGFDCPRHLPHPPTPPRIRAGRGSPQQGGGIRVSCGVRGKAAGKISSAAMP